MNPNRLYPFAATAALLTALPAHAHHAMEGQIPSTFVQGLLSGLAHPVIGVDHFAFLLVVGLLAVSLTGAARLLVPAAFVAATVAGTGIHLAAVSMPLAEITVAFSVLLGGVLVLLRRQLPALLLGSGVAAFGLFHGYAYGESIVGAEATPLAAYLVGFSLIQYALVIGVMLGVTRLAARSEHLRSLAIRGTGIAAAATGSLMLAVNLA
jgi:urease accessory protein